eukprot:Skav233547  [mRNA]  locus=scaffold563:108550:114196:+ [translate_table: standard]
MGKKGDFPCSKFLASQKIIMRNDEPKPAARYYSFHFPVERREDSQQSSPYIEFLVTDSVGLEGGMMETPEWRRFEEVVVGHRPLRTLADRGPSGQSVPEAAAAKQLREALALNGKPVVFLHGHDHVMQHFVENDKPLYHFGNGVGGMGLHPLKRCSNCTEFKWGESAHGFAVHELSESSINVHFVDINQQVRHSERIPYFTA